MLISAGALWEAYFIEMHETHGGLGGIQERYNSGMQ